MYANNLKDGMLGLQNLSVKLFEIDYMYQSKVL